MIHFVVALAPEADPIVRRYRMDPEEGAWSWYRSEEAALVVSGIGKLAAAAATSFLHAKTGERRSSAWLNVGTCGHRARPLGEVLSAHTVTDASSGERVYPTRLEGPKLPAIEVVSVDRPETELASDAAYDMEAFGFCRAALRFTTSELVRSLKVVSDNRVSPAAAWTPARARRLVEDAMEAIALEASHLAELSAELDGGGRELEVERLLRSSLLRWRFTASESRRLRRLLVRWAALDLDELRATPELPDAPDAPEAMRRLETTLRTLALERPL